MTGWKLTWGVHSWTEDDLNGDHVALLALIYKDESWAPLGTSPLDGPIALMAYLAAFRAVAEQRDCLEVQIEVASTRLSTLLDCVSVDDRLPKPEGVPVDMPAPV